MTGGYTTRVTRLWAVAAIAAAGLWLSACASTPAARPMAMAAPANMAGAQRAYDRGVALYAADRYGEAKAAWLEAARLAPGTGLARKSQENVARADAVLRKLRELDSQ